ncbi:MAG: ankyrin repeat domain-containing protein, partial [Gammaproteobacteria bacterium]|nr:ankyrin repeat domain-containing protein [Gammaproteobacteria bacterium]
FRPSFSMIDTEDEEMKQEIRKKQKGREKFNLEDIIEAPNDVPGIVHHNTIASVREYFKTRQMYIPHLKVNKIVGLSFRKNAKNILNWLSRSTLNYSVYDTNPVASVCFHFPADQSSFFRPQYLAIYNLQRTLEKEAFNKIREATKNSLLKKHELKEIPIEEQEKYQKNELQMESSNKLFGMNEWLEIRASKEKIAEYMMRTIFFSSGLLPSGYAHAPFQPDNAEVIQNVLKVAIEYDIPLNLNYIPSFIFSEDNAFVHACRKGDLESANLLLNYEAKYQSQLNKPLINDFKIKNNLLSEALFKYSESNKIKMPVVEDVISHLKKNIQPMHPQINDSNMQDAKLSETIHSYTIPGKSLLHVLTDLNHFDMMRLLVMSSSENILNNALLYTIKQNKLEFIKIILETNLHITDQQEILLQSALTGNLAILQFIKEQGIKLLDDTAITTFNKNIRKGLLSIAKTGDYLKVKQLKDEFKIEFSEKYNKRYTLTDKLFQIFITHIIEDNLKAVLSLKEHLYETFINSIHRNEIYGTKCEKHTFALQMSIECGAINLFQFLMLYYKDIEQEEKRCLLNDTLVARMVKCTYDKNFIEIVNILDKYPDISVKNVNSHNESVESALSQNFRLYLYEDNLVGLQKILYFFPKFYQDFLNYKNDCGYTMMVAIYHSSNEVIEFLLKNNNINLEVIDQNGNTLLLAALKDLKHFPIVSKLLEKGANTKAVNHAGMSVNDLMIELIINTARKDRVSQIKLIVDTCKKHNIMIDFNKPSKISEININDRLMKLFMKHLRYDGFTYALCEDEKCFPELFQQFLCSKDDNGNSPIMIAAIESYALSFATLIDKKIDLELRNSKGNTVLLIAALDANLNFVSKLLEKNVNQHIRNLDGFTFEDGLIDGLCKKLKFNSNFSLEIKKFAEKHPAVINYNKLLLRLLPTIDRVKLKCIFNNIKCDLFNSIPGFIDALEIIYTFNPEEYQTRLKSFTKLAQLLQKLNAIPDCKSIEIITKDVYSKCIAIVNNPEEIFNKLLNDTRNLNARLLTHISYRGVPRLFIKSENVIIKEKLDFIIKNFSNDIIPHQQNYATI